MTVPGLEANEGDRVSPPQHASIARPVLCLVTDRATARGPLDAIIEAAVEGGVDRLQIRERHAPGTELAGDAALLALVDGWIAAAHRGAAARRGRVEVIVNRRADLALSAGADGVHAGFDALPVSSLRALLGAQRLVGVSCHDADEAAAATRAGASYVHLAPIFAPHSKHSTRPPLGLGAITDARAHGAVVIAQGGIDETTAGAALRAGAVGIAVTGAILGADDPGAASARLRRALDAG